MRFFYIALAETRHLEDIFQLLDTWSHRLHPTRGVLVGALVRFTKWRSGCLPCKLAEKYGVPLFVDNGAFSYLTASELENPTLDSGKINMWIMDYSSWIAAWHNHLTAYALPDIPVHGREFLPPELRRRRIELTARLHERFTRLLRSKEPHAITNGVVVLQGYTLDEYMYSLKLHMNNIDLLSETRSFNPGREPYGGIFGVGSVCVRKPSSKGKTAVIAEGKAAGTLNSFMKQFLEADWPQPLIGFHFFGLHTDAIKAHAMHPRYYASDTGAHGLNYKYKWRTVLGCRRLDRDCYLSAIDRQIRISLAPLITAPLSQWSR